MGKIYLISAYHTDDEKLYYKIGITKNSSEKRLKQLQTFSHKLYIYI